jgi:hypothetical protein
MEHAFWNCRGSSFDSVFWVSIYGTEDTWWHRFLILPIYRVGRAVNTAKYWLLYRFHPGHQYHIVKPKLRPGHYDPDSMILHACFTLLGRYIEEEGGFEAIKNEGDTIHVFSKEQREAVVTLWQWWTVDKAEGERQRDAWLDALFGGKHSGLKTKPVEGTDQLHEWVGPSWDAEEKKLYERFRALEDKLEADEQTMLHRLIDIRRGLWT